MQQLREDEDSDIQRSDNEPDERSRAAVTRASRADVSSLFAKIRSAKANVASSAATVPLAAIARMGNDENSEFQHSDKQTGQESRADVARKQRAGVAAVFAQARQTRTLAASASDAASSATTASESLQSPVGRHSQLFTTDAHSLETQRPSDHDCHRRSCAGREAAYRSVTEAAAAASRSNVATLAGQD